MRGLAVLPGVTALIALAASPASAAQWTYDLKTTDGDPGGRATGRVYYESTSSTCFTAGTDGYLDDREADGYGVIIYLRGRLCSNGKLIDYEAGYTAGAGKDPVYYNTGYLGNIRDVTARICLYKDGADHYCRTA